MLMMLIASYILTVERFGLSVENTLAAIDVALPRTLHLLVE